MCSLENDKLAATQSAFSINEVALVKHIIMPILHGG